MTFNVHSLSVLTFYWHKRIKLDLEVGVQLITITWEGLSTLVRTTLLVRYANLLSIHI